MKRISLIKTIGTVGVLGTSSIVLATNLTSCSKIETITIDFGELISIESDDHFGFISFAKFESHDYRTIITTEDDKKPNGIHSDDYLFSTAQKLYLMCNSSSKGDVATLMFIDSIPPVEGKQTIVAWASSNNEINMADNLSNFSWTKIKVDAFWTVAAS